MSRLYEWTDCPCNSLALNWLQMSCCMPSPAPDGNSNAFEAVGSVHNCESNGHTAEERSPIHNEEDTTAASYWMEHVSQIAPKTKFRDLLIVGSHDTASCTIPPSRPFSAVARCQNLTVLQQLEAGIRLLDLRLGSHRGSNQSSVRENIHSDVWVWHGSLEGGPFLPILQQIDMFVTDHSKEVVILNIVPEYGVPFSSEQKLFILKRINETFGSRMITASEMKSILSSWTLGDLNKKGKQVLVLFHPRICEDLKVSFGTSSTSSNSKSMSKKHSREWTASEIEAEYDVVNADAWMRNLWFNTRQNNDLFEMVLEDIRRHGKKKQNRLYCSQFVLTPGVGGIWDVVKALAGTNPIRPMSLSQHLYKNQLLNNFLRSNVQEPWNLFLLDFVDYCPWTVRFLTALNFPVPVTISMAVYHDGGTKNDPLDVTQKLAQNTYRGRVVFVTNLQEELLDTTTDGNNCCSGNGSLVVAYSLGGSTTTMAAQYYVITIPIVAQAPLLMISYFATSSESVVTIPRTNDEGLIHNGKILSSRASVRNLNGIVLRFKRTESNCVFDLMDE